MTDHPCSTHLNQENNKKMCSNWSHIRKMCESSPWWASVWTSSPSGPSPTSLSTQTAVFTLLWESGAFSTHCPWNSASWNRRNKVCAFQGLWQAGVWCSGAVSLTQHQTATSVRQAQRSPLQLPMMPRYQVTFTFACLRKARGWNMFTSELCKM